MTCSTNLYVWTDANFEAEVLGSEVPVLVDFSAKWCGPCKMLSPIVEQLADDFAGKVKIGKIDIDQSPEVASKYGVRAVPTMIVFDKGEKKGQLVGLANRDKLVKLLGV